jgi:hypothetical protein
LKGTCKIIFLEFFLKRYEKKLKGIGASRLYTPNTNTMDSANDDSRIVTSDDERPLNFHTRYVTPTHTAAAVSAMDTSYAPAIVATMDDATLISEFSRLTGCVALACKHCHKTSLPLENFTLGIRAATAKLGLSPSTKLPKTCNAQKKTSAICNKFYYRMSRVDAETALKIKETMKDALKSAQTNENPVEPVTPPRKFVPKAAMKT